MTEMDRRQFWLRQGATDSEATELTAYAQSGFEPAALERPFDCPMPDEPLVAAWEQYVASAARVGVADSLRRPFMQLRFEIVEGMSARPAYLAAVRRGVWAEDPAEPGVTFARPEALRIFIHPTAAGRLPVVVAGAREDFEAILRALTCRNEPRPIPAAMGASILAGYNNWDRVAALGPMFSPAGTDRALYQDRIVILSSGAYSGVPAGEVGVGSDEWLRLSLTIRLEHECATT